MNFMKNKSAIFLIALFAMIIVCTFSVVADDVVTIVFAKGRPTHESGTGWSYDTGTDTLSLENGYSFTTEGACNVTVINRGTIVGGTWSGKFSNTGNGDKKSDGTMGTINGGTFNGDVKNYDPYDTCVINDGEFYGDVENGNHGTVNGGRFYGDFKNKLGATVKNARFPLEFVTNGGVWNDFEVPIYYDYSTSTGAALPTSKNISKGDDIFAGWYTNKEFSGSAVSNIPAKSIGKLTLYARFTDPNATWALVGAQAEDGGIDYTIYSDGNYSVKTAKGLAYIANIVNGGDDLYGKTVELLNDIDMLDGGVTGYGKDTFDEFNGWEPMGSFAGTFEGNGHSISNLYVSKTNEDAGLIASNSGTVKNLEIKSGSIVLTLESDKKISVSAGGICAVNSGILENLVNRADITVSHGGLGDVYYGGIVGHATVSTSGRPGIPDISLVKNCVNYGTISSSDSTGNALCGGGIAGQLYSGYVDYKDGNGEFVYRGSAITNCRNEGNVTSSMWAGGVVGKVKGLSASNSNYKATVMNCENAGKVSGDTVGGIAGADLNTARIYNSFNDGEVSGKYRVGGIVGNSNGATSVIANSYNLGAVSGQSDSTCVGEIVGYMGTGSANGGISNCYYRKDDTLFGAYGEIGGGSMKDVTAIYRGMIEIDGKLQAAWSKLDTAVYGTDDLLDALNEWVFEQNDDAYTTWTFGYKDGYFRPVFGKKVKITPHDVSWDVLANGYPIELKSLFDIDKNAGDATYTIIKTGADGEGKGTIDGDRMTVTESGTFKIMVSVAANGEYGAARATVNITVSVETGLSVNDSLAGQCTYGGAPLKLWVEIQPKSRAAAQDTIDFYVVEGDDERKIGTADVTYDTFGISGKAEFEIDPSDKLLNIGENTIYADYGGNLIINGSQSDTFTIVMNPKTVDIDWPVQSYEYDGKPKDVKARVKPGELVEGDGEITCEVVGGDETNVGEYTAKISKLVGENAKYYEVHEQNAKFTYYIDPKDISEATVTPTKKLVYNGEEQTQEIEVTLDGFDEITYDVSGDKATDVKADGSYTLTVKGTGNFTGEVEFEWNIAEAAPAANTEKVTRAEMYYGYPLSSANIIEGEFTGLDGRVLTGTFEWVDGDKIIETHSVERMKFIPDDTNYAEVEFDVNVAAWSPTSADNGIPDTEPSNKKDDNAKTDDDTKVDDKDSVSDDKDSDNDNDMPNIDDQNKDDEQTTKPNHNKIFIDVHPLGHWAIDDIDYVYDRGLMMGMSEDEFGPEEYLTRGMLVTILYRAEGEPAVNKSRPFADVTMDKYYANAVIWAKQNGIVNGMTENEFAPEEYITREQFATIMYRYAKYKGVAPTGAWAIRLDYADLGEISEYALEAVMYAKLSGIMNGKNDNLFAPKDLATRAEAAAILHRFTEGI